MWIRHVHLIPSVCNGIRYPLLVCPYKYGVSGQIDHTSSRGHCCSARGVRLVQRNVGILCAYSWVKPGGPGQPLRTICRSHCILLYGIPYTAQATTLGWNNVVNKLFCRHLSKMERRRRRMKTEKHVALIVTIWARHAGTSQLSQHPEDRRRRVMGHFWLPHEFNACQGYMRPCLNETTKPNQIIEI